MIKTAKNTLDQYLPPLLVVGGLGLLAYFLLGTTAAGGGGGGNGGGGGGNGGGGGGNGGAAKALTSGNAAQVSAGPNVGTGIPVRQTEAFFVESGRYTPTSFVPAAITGTIGTSRALEPAEEAQVLRNLTSPSLPVRPSAWWTPAEQQITNPAGYGLSAAGTPQSDIAPGVRHCTGPGPGAPATDTWHYC